jgi:hypothetical protein
LDPSEVGHIIRDVVISNRIQEGRNATILRKAWSEELKALFREKTLGSTPPLEWYRHRGVRRVFLFVLRQSLLCSPG